MRRPKPTIGLLATNKQTNKQTPFIINVPKPMTALSVQTRRRNCTGRDLPTICDFHHKLNMYGHYTVDLIQLPPKNTQAKCRCTVFAYRVSCRSTVVMKL
jgi:hypothetical protein